MDKYPVLKLIVRYGDQLSVLAAVLTLFMAVGSQKNKLDPMGLSRSFGLAVLAGFGIKNLTELNQIISDALLPQ